MSLQSAKFTDMKKNTIKLKSEIVMQNKNLLQKVAKEIRIKSRR